MSVNMRFRDPSAKSLDEVACLPSGAQSMPKAYRSAYHRRLGSPANTGHLSFRTGLLHQAPPHDRPVRYPTNGDEVSELAATSGIPLVFAMRWADPGHSPRSRASLVFMIEADFQKALFSSSAQRKIAAVHLMAAVCPISEVIPAARSQR